MTRVFRVALAALVLMAVSAPKAAQETSSFTSTAVALRPTDHPRVPRELSQFWMAPDKGRVRTAAQANLATAIKFENGGDHAKALALLTNPATKQDGPLATYAEYYKGLALLHLGRAADARATFRACVRRTPSAISLRWPRCVKRSATKSSAIGPRRSPCIERCRHEDAGARRNPDEAGEGGAGRRRRANAAGGVRARSTTTTR